MFERAVARVVLKHPNLHLGIVGEHTSSPSWTHIEQIDLRNHIEWIAVGGGAEDLQDRFQEICSQELDTKFSNYRTRPGWRLKVLREENSDSIEVLLVLNHTNMDGGSARIFHADLLQSLHDDPHIPQEVALQDHVLKLPEASLIQLSPPAEDLASFQVDSKAVLYYLQHEVRTPASKYPKTSTQAHWAPIMQKPFRTQFRSISISNHVLSRLLQACRHNETTLTGLLHALGLMSLAPLLGPSRACAFEHLTAMNLRPFLPKHPPTYSWLDPEAAMNNYVTIQNHVFDDDFVARLHALIVPYAPQSFQSGALMQHMWAAAR
ncbi:hypothetical protein NX059_011728 [Plenodomus lindquistii]|nr:hypothetical protein NX059_011728 [Plenodomus lindquistii]